MENEHRSCGSPGVVGRQRVVEFLSEVGKDALRLPATVAHVYENTENQELYVSRG